MRNPAAPSPSDLALSPGPCARAALACTERRLLEAVLFEGARWAELARAWDAPVTELRQRVAAALLALQSARGVAAADRADRGGAAIEVALALHALDALDPDQAALVEVLLVQQPALQLAYDEYRELVGELCATAPRVAPPAGALERLRAAIGDDRALS
ncbi:MAG TPA: hypothetical protein VFT22_21165 [Kofleriaceae bacterium]|nr:hypothetical protein [Kofleriaceae bacterium]